MNSDYGYVLAPDDWPGKRFDSGCYVYEHHLVWWEQTGEVIEWPFTLHHINGDRKDNRFENLEKLHVGEHVARHNAKPIRHGTLVGRRGCRCDACVGVQREYMRKWKAARSVKGRGHLPVEQTPTG